MELDIAEELFPARRSLLGLQFPDEQEFARARALAACDPTAYHELYPIWRMVVVRRADVTRFVDAGLHFNEIEQVDDEELPPEEVARRDRALIDSRKKVLFARACHAG